jgi:diguanylate cyclase (GGDEF)-like protein/PAS domain S-box-containing protein
MGIRWDETLTIRGRLFLLLLALAVPFSVFLTLSSWRQAAEEREHARQQMLGIARLTSARLDDHIGDIRQLLAVLAQVVDASAGASEKNSALLRAVVSRLPPQIDNLGIWTASGDNVGVLDSRSGATSPNVRTRKFFIEAMRGGDLAVEAPAMADGERVGLFAVAIERGGRAVGVVSASARLNTLQSLLMPDGALPPGAVITVLDASGVVIARSLDPDHWIGRNLRPHTAADERARDGVRDGPSADGVPRIGGFTTARHVPWLVYVGIPTGAALAPVTQRLIESALVGLAMLALGLTAASFVGQRISRPLQQLSDDAAALQRGELDHRSRVRQGGEIGQLATTLNRMSEALQERTISLEASQFQLRQITDNLPVMISYVDRDQRFRFANSAYRSWVGFDTDELIGQSLLQAYGEAGYEGFRRHVEAALKGERVVYERDLISLSGPRRIEATLIPHRTADGDVLGLFVLVQDVTANREAAALQARSEERLSLALEGSGLALFDWDLCGDRIYQSAQAAAMRGEPALEETTTPAALRQWVHPDDLENMTACLRAAVVGDVPKYDSEFRIRARNGRCVWLRAKGRVVERDESGRALRLAGTYTDITSRKAADERLRHLAEFDALTGLPNRALFNDRLAQAMIRAARSHKTTALLFLDIDHFKVVNDSLGHEAGDRLLVDFARALQARVRASDTVARLAGDEFTVILEGLRGRDDAEKIAQTLVDSVRRKLKAGGKRVAVTTSIGIAILAPNESDPAAVLRRADAALYEAKRCGRDRFVCAATEDHPQADDIRRPSPDGDQPSGGATSAQEAEALALT